MHKIILLTIFLTLFVFAKDSLKDENIQILAENLEIKDDIVNATGEVVVYSPNYYITANRLVYDKINSKLELFGEVNVIKNNEVISYSQYMFLDIKNDINSLKPMLMVDNTSKLWFNAESGVKNNDLIDLDSSTLSSCDCLNPAWSISFSSGDMNTTDKWVNTYNTTLYIQNVPVFYTPYFGFPTDTTRRTGLLKPTVGYSKTEGFMYAQPIYYAPQLNYDFEYTPQIRTNRGKGNSLKYRYVDSRYSSLKIE
ncbi:MAG: LPS-assembly protein LptD, partial [Arcobacteraceae bacterium]